MIPIVKGLSIRVQLLNCLWPLLFALIIFGSAKPRIIGYDDIERFKAIDALFTSLTQYESIDLKYSSSLGIIASPLYFLGRITGSPDDLERNKRHTKSVVASFNHVLLLIFSVYLIGFIQRHIGLARPQAGFSVFLMLVCSLALPYSKTFYSELLWSCLVFVWLEQLSCHSQATSRQSAMGFFTATLLIWSNSALILIALPLLIYHCYLSNKLHLSHLGGLLTGIALAIIENLFERGTFFSTGYTNEHFTFEMHGLLGVLFSAGKGILWFFPGIFLGWLLLEKRDYPLHTIRLFDYWGLITIGLVLVFGSWWDWGGGRYWGPRFFLLPSIFASILLAMSTFAKVSRAKKGVALGLLMYQALVVVIGMTVGQNYFDLCTSANNACYSSWEQSPFYIFARPISEWKQLVSGRYLWVALICLFVAVKLVKMKVPETIRRSM